MDWNKSGKKRRPPYRFCKRIKHLISVNTMTGGFAMKKDKSTPSSSDYSKYPDTSFDLINKYGTYEIQPTSDTDQPFPKIAQGLPKKETRNKK